MSADSYAAALEVIKTNREQIWLDRPAELAAIRGRLGAMGQNLTTLCFADKDTHSIMKYLHTLRDAAGEGVDLAALKALARMQLAFDKGRFERYYLAPGIAQVFEAAVTAIDQAADADQFRTAVAELLLYAMRLNFWVDLEIPWPKLVESLNSD